MDWGAMMRAALALGVGPEAFWRLSVREWRMMTERPEGVRPMSRDELVKMQEAWPDE